MHSVNDTDFPPSTHLTRRMENNEYKSLGGKKRMAARNELTMPGPSFTLD